ncbi:MAG: response regulator [Planctomycetaceae bacterium]|nr:response regulator [Planctomycetaceae bacterium]
MSVITPTRTILMADDDGEDCSLVRDALGQIGRSCNVRFVHNGEELLDYLRCRGEFKEHNPPLPDLILLDLKMPRKDGRETLRELKSDPRLRRIPVIVLTTSTAETDVVACYDLGVNSFLAKPATYRQLVDLLETLTQYWFEMAELPPRW